MAAATVVSVVAVAVPAVVDEGAHLAKGATTRAGFLCSSAPLVLRHDRGLRTSLRWAVQMSQRGFRRVRLVPSSLTDLGGNPLICFRVSLQHVRMMLTREEAENACAGVAEGVSSACREALRATGLAADDVDDVELLGGGSYIPALRRSVEEVFG